MFVARNYTKEQLNILNKCAAGAALAADIVHAHVTIYVNDEDDKCFYVFAQAQPLTKFVKHQPSMVGRVIRKVEEPLATRTFARNVEVEGKREWVLGSFAYLKMVPLRDSKGGCFGVVGFEMNSEHNDGENLLLIDAALKLMRNMATHKAKQDKNYRRMGPSDGLMLVDKNTKIIVANDTARHIFSVLGVDNLVGMRTSSIKINWPLVSMVLKTGIAEGKELTEQGLALSMRAIPVAALPNASSAIVVVTDITELRKKDEELLIKSVVIKEIHHRVKNNLQTIASLLRLQARRAKAEETKLILRDCINRVNSIALVHESLSRQESGTIDVRAVARGIYEAILSSMVNPDLQLETTFEADNVFLPSEEANAIALTLNELLQNALEHGFEGRKKGKLLVRFKKMTKYYSLEITDDGVGLPPNFVLGQAKSLGLKIIQTMVESDLGGSFELVALEQGTCARITVPIKMEE